MEDKLMDKNQFVLELIFCIKQLYLWAEECITSWATAELLKFNGCCDVKSNVSALSTDEGVFFPKLGEQSKNK